MIINTDLFVLRESSGSLSNGNFELIDLFPATAFMGIGPTIGTLSVAMNPDQMPGITTIARISHKE